GATVLGQRRAGRAVGRGSTGKVGPVRLPPRARRDLLGGGRRIDGVMDPAMPSRADGGGLGEPLVYHPAPLEAKRRIDPATLHPVIAVAILVAADEFAVARAPEQGPERRPVPPGEDSDDEILRLHRSHPGAAKPRRIGLFASARNRPAALM